MIEPGQTLAIGGLIQTVSTGNVAKVPFLGGLPFIGTAFRTVTTQKQERELIIVVTPRLVDPLAANQLPSLLPGQETRMPDDFELFLEGILEAPRGLRTVVEPGKGFGRYRASYMAGPNAGLFPCPGPGCSGPMGMGDSYVSGSIVSGSYGAHNAGQPIYTQPQGNPQQVPTAVEPPNVLPPGSLTPDGSVTIPSSVPNIPGPSRN